jgi:hypothetical protein
MLLEEVILVSAEYTEEDVNVVGEKEVVVFADCTIAELVCRNISSAVEIKQDALRAIEEALEKEIRALALLNDYSADESLSSLGNRELAGAKRTTASAIRKQMSCRDYVNQSVEQMQSVRMTIGCEPNSP